jgi:hypothetical protein
VAAASASAGSDVNPMVFGRINNFVTLASNYGVMQQRWQGYDFTLNARRQNGILLQRGVSSGKGMTDNCDMVHRSGCRALIARSGRCEGVAAVV